MSLADSSPHPTLGMERAREIVAGLPRLTTIPEAASHAAQLAQDPESSLEDLAAAFAADAALCSHLLKVANSAYYGVRAQVASVDRAAVVLGRRVLRNVAVAASMRAIVRRMEDDVQTVKRLWRRSVRSAAAASALAEATGACLSGEAFAAGLIHDFGALVQLEADPLTCGSFLEAHAQARDADTARTLLAEEEQVFGASHVQFGAALCEAWSFPQMLCDVAHHHHAPGGAEGEARNMVALVRVGELLAEDEIAEDLVERVRAVEGSDALGLDVDEFETLAERLRELAELAEVAFG